MYLVFRNSYLIHIIQIKRYKQRWKGIKYIYLETLVFEQIEPI